MKTISFYLLIFTPFLMLVLSAKFALITPLAFVILLGLYVVLYHPTIVGMRLLAKHVITKDEFGKTYIPLWNLKYFGEAFF